MNLNYGINSSISVKAARTITVASTTAVGLLGTTTDNTQKGLHKYNNATQALKGLIKRAGSGSTATTYHASNDVINALKAIELQTVNCPIIVNLDLANNIETAAALFTTAEAVTGINLRGGLIVAPTLSATATVATKLVSVATKLWATALIDNFGASEADVLTFANAFSSDSALICHGNYSIGKNTKAPASAIYAGVMARYDAPAYGWAKSHSNRVALGVSAVDRAVEYLDGQDCEARRLRQKGVALIVNDIGWRTYGFETTATDSIWQSLDRVRCFRRLLLAIIKSAKWARDREANELLNVKDSVVTFMNELKGNDVIIGFSAEFDISKNTKATVSAGKFYFTIKVGDMPSVRELNIELVYSDNWNNILINTINKT